MEEWPYSCNNWFITGNNKIEVIGNYWSDYEDRYPQSKFDRNGTWDGKDYQIPLSLFLIPCDPLSRNYDKGPWCRENGWRECLVPDKPDLSLMGTNAIEINISRGNYLTFQFCTCDVNNDSLQYGFNWSSCENDDSCKFENLNRDGDWLTNGDEYYCPGEICKKQHYFDTVGTFFVRVCAKDFCKKDCASDGMSLWSNAIQVTVLK